MKRRIGEVPYLNGGLFDQEADDESSFFPDAIVAKILSELVYRYNFTVTEYYTPKPMVAFMCRETLKGYLKTSLPAEGEEALALFVDKNDPPSCATPS